MSDLQNISLRIDFHKIELTIPREHEPLYRQAAVTLNQTFKRYREEHPDSKLDELWIYTALEIAVNLHSDLRKTSQQPVKDKLTELNQQILQQL